MMKVLFLGFNCVIDTGIYDNSLSKDGLPGNDSFGTCF
jgi:hypothetical protein